MSQARSSSGDHTRACGASPACSGPCVRVRVQCGLTMPWDELQAMRRNTLKRRKPHDLDKLCAAILRSGFAFPVHVWGGHDYVIDGAGRMPALERLEAEGHVIPMDLPVALIDAETEAEAAEFVLMASSHHGSVTDESLLEFAEVHAIQLEQMAQVAEFQGVSLEKVAREQAEGLGAILGELPGQIAAESKQYKVMSFCLHSSQYESVDEAVKLAKIRGLGVSDENDNGNALHGICAAYLCQE